MRIDYAQKYRFDSKWYIADNVEEYLNRSVPVFINKEHIK